MFDLEYVHLSYVTDALHMWVWPFHTELVLIYDGGNFFRYIYISNERETTVHTTGINLSLFL
jgi:hypothetical protein